ncbi:MAG: ABC transporter ATP-binding protein [Eggerthellaceae bacterium]|nr:ABC transporter ATP-binding protein [Eggerthellaceae bacterium]
MGLFSEKQELETKTAVSSDIAVSVTGLTKTFSTRKAVDKVSFELPKGAFLSVFGPNGAGKTTLLRMLSTLTRPTDGSIFIDGIDALEEPDIAREHMGLISHNAMLYPDLTAEENLLFYARLYGVKDPEKRVIELLDAVGLKHRRLDLVRTFSRGMTQRVSIARALINDPSVVLLDEPYSGLDPHAIEVFDQLIESVREDRTFIMVSHDLEKGLSMCTHALVLAKGRVVTFAERGDLDADEFRELYRSTVGMGVA